MDVHKIRVILTLVSIVMSPLLYAELPTTDEGETIVVTASPLKAKIVTSASSISSLDEKSIRQEQSVSLGDTIDKEVGVSNISTGDQAGKPVIRGLSSNRIRILVDGIAQDHQQFGVRHQPNVDPFQSDRIEIVRGPLSVLYGADALGGVINVLSKPLIFDQESWLNSGRLTSRYGVNNRLKMLGVEAAGGNKHWAWNTTLSHHDADNFETPNDATFAETQTAGTPKFTGEIPFTDYQIANASFAVGHNTDSHEITLRYSDWQNQQNYLQPDASVTGQELTNSNLMLRGSFWLGDDWQLNSVINQQSNLRKAGTGIAFQELNPANIDLEIELDKTIFRAGLIHPYLGHWKGEFGVEYTSKEQNTPVGDLVPGADYHALALYLFEQTSINKYFIQAGLRYDRIDQSPNSTLARPINDTSEKSWSAITGSLGLTYQVNEHWYIAGNIARGFRTPSIFELYADGVHGGIAAIQRGNPDLKEEYALNTDLGVRYDMGEFDFTFTYFYNDISDYIYQANTGQTAGMMNLPVYVIEQSDAVLDGVEFALHWHPSEYLTLSANLTTVDGDLKTIKETLPLLPADNILVGIDWLAGDYGAIRQLNLRLGAKHSWAKDAAGPYEPFAQFDNNSFGVASVSSYQLVDAGISFDWYLDALTTQVDIKISNLLDSSYRDFLDTYKGYTLGMGRNIQVALSWDF